MMAEIIAIEMLNNFLLDIFFISLPIKKLRVKNGRGLLIFYCMNLRLIYLKNRKNHTKVTYEINVEI